MSFPASIERLVAAVLYEGYVLYPYRRALKNQQRWTFGGVYPQGYCKAHSDERWQIQSEFLIEANRDASISVTLGFLQLIERSAAECSASTASPPLDAGWQDTVERHVTASELRLEQLAASPSQHHFEFPAASKPQLDDLRRIVRSMRDACAAANVQLVTGDTKVVDRGKGDGVFITTSGIGHVPRGRRLSIREVQPGDKLLVSGTIGDHGVAIMSVREGIDFETRLESDTAPLHDLTRTMLDACPSIRWMRDPTRGGVSSTLNELAAAARVGVVIKEPAIPIRPEVRAACEMLGLDPLYVANEGKLIAAVPPHAADELLAVMRRHPLGKNAALIGEAVDDHAGLVVQRTVIGGERIVTMLSGEQLPRIC